MSFNYDNIVKDSDPIVREKSVTVPIPMHEEDKELLMDMLQYVLSLIHILLVNDNSASILVLV